MRVQHYAVVVKAIEKTCPVITGKEVVAVMEAVAQILKVEAEIIREQCMRELDREGRTLGNLLGPDSLGEMNGDR